MKKYPNITRIDHDKSRIHGWRVRFQRWKNGKPETPITKLFSDEKYGGRRYALGAAITWRDENKHRFPLSRRATGSVTGRKPQEVGYENVIEFPRKMTRADGTEYRVPVLLAKIKVTRDRFESTQRSIGNRSKASVLRDIEQWFSGWRAKIAKRGSRKNTAA